MKMANFCNAHFDNKITINSIVSERRKIFLAQGEKMIVNTH